MAYIALNKQQPYESKSDKELTGINQSEYHQIIVIERANIIVVFKELAQKPQCRRHSHCKMTKWSDIGKHRVVAIFKRKIGVNPRPVSYHQFYRQVACCLIHWRCCYVHRVFCDTVNVTDISVIQT